MTEAAAESQTSPTHCRAEHPEQSSELRARGIGSSDAPKIANLVKQCSPYKLYMQKIGIVDADEYAEEAYWGSRLEPVILSHYAETVGLHVVGKSDFGDPYYSIHRPDGTTDIIKRGESGGFADAIELVREVWHSRISHMLAHLDGVGCKDNGEPRRFVEAKTAGIWIADEFGREGTDEIPKRYIVQCNHQSEITHSLGLALPYDVPTLIAGQEHRLFTVERNERLVNVILKMNAEFWMRLELRDPPEPDGSPWTSKILTEIHPEDDGTVVDIHPQDVRMALVRQYRRAQIREKEAKRETARARNVIKEMMEKEAKWRGENWSITYRRPKPKMVTDWEAAFTEFRNHLAINRTIRIDTAFQHELDRIIENNTEEKQDDRKISPSLTRLALPAPKEVTK